MVLYTKQVNIFRNNFNGHHATFDQIGAFANFSAKSHAVLRFKCNSVDFPIIELSTYASFPHFMEIIRFILWLPGHDQWWSELTILVRLSSTLTTCIPVFKIVSGFFSVWRRKGLKKKPPHVEAQSNKCHDITTFCHFNTAFYIPYAR